MNDYQMPLFDRYDMSVEFDRRVRPLKQRLREEWDRYSFKSDGELIEQFQGEIVGPLEIFPETSELQHIDGSLYEWEIPFQGDNELWHLYPVDVVWGLYGELFRGDLILQCHADSKSAAQRELDKRVSQISLILDLQRQRIETFESGFASVIVAEARMACRVQPRPVGNV